MCLDLHETEVEFKFKVKLGIDANNGTVLFFHIILSLFMFWSPSPVASLETSASKAPIAPKLWATKAPPPNLNSLLATANSPT